MLQKKVARLCWNSHNWVRPSGAEGKNKNGDKNKLVYERDYGFGHEEWLFDTAKIINGYHYGFIQGLGAKKHQGEIYDIYLYAIDSTTKNRWWIGRIKRAIVISDNEKRIIQGEYKKRGWLNEMQNQLDTARDRQKFEKIKPGELALFNVKYSVGDLELEDQPLCFSKKDKAVSSNYYNLQDYIAAPQNTDNFGKFTFTAGHNTGATTATQTYGSGSKKIELAEKKMQDKVYKHLCDICGKNNVGTEQATGFGSRIDIVARNTQKDGKYAYTYYELKVSESPLMCIRHALSQLIEYSYYPNHSKAEILVIVSHHKISDTIREYLKNLRRSLNLPVYYQRFDMETEKLESELA